MSEPTTLPQGVRTSLPRAAWLFVMATVAAATVVVALYLPAAVRQLADGAWPDIWPPLLFAASLVEFLGFHQLVAVERFLATFHTGAKRREWGVMPRAGIPSS